MKLRQFRLTALLTGGILLLAACGTGSPANPDPDPPGDPTQLSGIVRTPTSSGQVGGTTVTLCEAGPGCSALDALTIPVSNNGQEAQFQFSNLTGTSFNLRARQNLMYVDPEVPPPGAQLPEIWNEGFLQNAHTGDVQNLLQMHLDASEPSNGTAVITGYIQLPGSLAAAAASEPGEVRVAAASEPGVRLTLPEADMSAASSHLTDGEIIVSFAPGVISTQSTLSAAGHELIRVAGDSGGERQLFDSGATTVEEALAIAAELSARSDVEFAMPNWTLHAFDTPNDSEFAYQWHYEAFNLPAAWDIQQGGAPVAVVDTGSISHPDLDFLPGFDFVTDPDSAGDGNGRDNNPNDEGSDFHGAHVAGTVGARTNNGTGVAGVSWATAPQVVPVRALGVNGGGSSFDILDSISWAVGDTVAGAPRNNNPVRIVNLSLGAELGVTCAQAMGGNTSFFDDLRNRNIILVVAAGNTDANSEFTFPANCPGVITVGATGPDDNRAPYSNHGSNVDIMAPGGDLTRSITVGGTTFAAGVLSTVTLANGTPGYGLKQGTSMAAPHVAGLVSLMRAVDPNVTLEEVRSALRNTARFVGCSTGGCGAGLVDAADALAQVAGPGTVPPPPPPPPPPPVEEGGAVYVYFEHASDPSLDEWVRFDEPALDFEFLVYNLPPTTYRVFAWIDLDGDESFDGTEPSGTYGELTLPPNSVTNGVEFSLQAPF